MDNKIIYISGPGYNAAAMAEIFDNVSQWCRGIINNIPFSSKSGKDLSVIFNIGYEYTDEYKDINAYAAIDIDRNADYKICLFASLIYNLWLSSRLPTGFPQPFEELFNGINAPLGVEKKSFV